MMNDPYFKGKDDSPRISETSIFMICGAILCLGVLIFFHNASYGDTTPVIIFAIFLAYFLCSMFIIAIKEEITPTNDNDDEEDSDEE